LLPISLATIPNPNPGSDLKFQLLSYYENVKMQKKTIHFDFDLQKKTKTNHIYKYALQF